MKIVFKKTYTEKIIQAKLDADKAGKEIEVITFEGKECEKFLNEIHDYLRIHYSGAFPAGILFKRAGVARFQYMGVAIECFR